MLVQRILTACVLIILVTLGIIYLPMIPFAATFAAICLIGLWEWVKLAKCSALLFQGLYLLGNAVVMYFVYFMPAGFVLSLGLVVWLILSLWVAKYPQGETIWQRFLGLRLIVGSLVIIPAWYAVIYLRFHYSGLALLFLMLFIIWSVDSAAYFSGKYFGRRKLAPEVSPNKSVEGLLGGVIFAAFVALAYTYWILHSHYFSLLFAVAVMATIFISVMGDLFESAVKRQAGVKDSGNILPGHGGILDRLDSLFAAAPIFAFGISLLDIS